MLSSTAITAQTRNAPQGVIDLQAVTPILGGRLETHIVDQLLPVEEVHLIAGPTGAGKTRWLVETVLAWSQGLPWFGYASFPVPWLYVAGDRTQAGCNRTFRSLDISPERIPLLPAWDLQLGMSGVIDRANAAGAKFLIFEGFHKYAEGINSKQVANWLQGISAMLRQNHLSILGVMEEPKMKPKDRYLNPRQRISGCAAWGHCCETIFLIEHKDEANITDPRRILYVCPRNAPTAICQATLADGHFRIIPGDEMVV